MRTCQDARRTAAGRFELEKPVATAKNRVEIADSLSGIGAQEWQVAATALASDAQVPTSAGTRGSTIEISVRAANRHRAVKRPTKDQTQRHKERECSLCLRVFVFAMFRVSR